MSLEQILSYQPLSPIPQEVNNIPGEQPNVIAIIRRDEHGKFQQILEPIKLHEQPAITFVPHQQGIYVVLGLLQESDEDQIMLGRFIETLAGRRREFPVGIGATPFGEQTHEW